MPMKSYSKSSEAGSPRASLAESRRGEAGLSQIVLLILLVAGLFVAFMAFQNARTILKPQADEGDVFSEEEIARQEAIPFRGGSMMAAGLASCDTTKVGAQKINVKWEDINAGSYSVMLYQLNDKGDNAGAISEMKCLPKGTVSYALPGSFKTTGSVTRAGGYEVGVVGYTDKNCVSPTGVVRAEIAQVENMTCKDVPSAAYQP